MTDPYRALCAELAEALHEHTCLYEGHESELVARARALLAEPVAQGPTDEELEEEFGAALLKLSGDSMNATAVAYARAVLARWGRPAAAPVPEPGEVGELVRWLLAHADEHTEEADGPYTRAATLLQQQAAPSPVVAPVPVSERLPGPVDCDAEGICWWFCPPDFMELRSHTTAESAFVAGATHWLAAHALPTPEAND